MLPLTSPSRRLRKEGSLGVADCTQRNTVHSAYTRHTQSTSRSQALSVSVVFIDPLSDIICIDIFGVSTLLLVPHSSPFADSSIKKAITLPYTKAYSTRRCCLARATSRLAGATPCSPTTPLRTPLPFALATALHHPYPPRWHTYTRTAIDVASHIAK